MPKKEKSDKDVEVIIQYENNTDDKEEKSLQKVMQKLFNSYITKVMQNANKGK